MQGLDLIKLRHAPCEREKQAGDRALRLGTVHPDVSAEIPQRGRQYQNRPGQTARRRRSGNVVTLRSNRRMTA
jgi:hypothetical protein